MTKKTETSLQSIAIADLHYTPDRRDMGDLKALAALIERNGYPPLEVIKDDTGYEIVDGRRRFEALKLLKFTEIECYVLADCEPDFSLTRNTGRLQLTPVEILDNMLRAGDQFDTDPLTPEGIKNFATKAGLSIDDALRLRTLSRCGEDIKELVHSKKMSLNIAILSVNLTEKQRAEFAKYCLSDRPSYRDAKRWLVNNKGSQNLRDAEFDTKGCKGCQYHGDNNPALFDQAELGKEEWERHEGQCFNPECYKRKLADFHDGMKLKAQKLGLKKAGISSQDRWSMAGLVEFAEAERIEPDKCSDCKLVKWCKGTPTKGKYVLYCPTACPNIKQPKGKKAEPESRNQVSILEKLEKNIPLTPTEKKEVIERNRQEIAAQMAGEAMDKNRKKISALNLLKMSLMHTPGIADKKLAALQAAKLEDLKDELDGLLQDLAEFSNGPGGLVQFQALHLLATGKPLDMAAVDAALPENVKGLMTPAKAEPAKTKKGAK